MLIDQTLPKAARPAGGLCLVTALCDPPAELLDKAQHLWPALCRRFEQIAMHVTSDTHPEWRAFLEEKSVPTAESTPAWDHIGAHRRRSLAMGLGHSGLDRLFYADPDHILRWVERKPDELDRVLALVGCWDCLVVGRSPAAFNVIPERLRATEVVVNRIYALMTGRRWDLMMAARGFSRRGAEHVVRTCREDTIGNDVAWPLLSERAGLSLGYAEADGLTYETNTVYARNTIDTEDEDARAWMLRVYAAYQHVEAMRPFLDDGRDNAPLH